MGLTNRHTEIIMVRSQGNNKRNRQKSPDLMKEERMAAAMDSGSSYHAETEDGRKRIPALHP